MDFVKEVGELDEPALLRGGEAQWDVERCGADQRDADRRIAPRCEDEEEGGGDAGGPDTAVVVKAKPKTQRPSMYKVLLLNDDYTPMEFVVHVLERFFGMGHERAVQIMMTVHNRGVAVVGVFTYEIAETKVTQVMDYARQHQHPLQCAMEKE